MECIMQKTKNNENTMDIDILGSIEFDLTEAIKDLIYNIKSIKKDVDMVKKHLNLLEEDN